MADQVARSTKATVRQSVCAQTARRRRRRRLLDASASRAMWPSIGSTATERIAPGTALRCRKRASSWTDIRGHTVTVSTTVVRLNLNRTAHHLITTDLYRRLRTTRLRAGRPLEGGPRRPIVLCRRDTSLTTTRTDITKSPTTCLVQRDCIPTRLGTDDRSSQQSAELSTSPTATTTLNGGGMVPSAAGRQSTTTLLATTHRFSGGCRLTRAVCCHAGQ